MWTINALFETIDEYMCNEVDGEMFEDEQDFENAIRAKLEEECFTVLPKRNVENTERMFCEGVNVDNQIPDIAVKCDDGSVLLELKLRRSQADYDSDIQKVENYVDQEKCDVGGVLFLDNEEQEDWETCNANPRYWYYLGSYPD